MTVRLLTLIIDRFVPDGSVVIGVDDTIERRWDRKIMARGIYRDPVRSNHCHFKALPVLALLAPSERADHGRRRGTSS